MTASLIAAHADPDQPGATFRALDAALAEQPGHRLFTILIHHPAACASSSGSTATAPPSTRSAGASR